MAAGSSSRFPFDLPRHFEKLRSSLEDFLAQNPDYEHNVFLMMRFRKTETFENIHRAIDKALKEQGLKCLRADRNGPYDEILWDNLRTYMLGCNYGIAVYEEIEKTGSSPNVAMELGFMFALGKKPMLLKESQVKLDSDLAGHYHYDFDINSLDKSIEMQIQSWVSSLGLKVSGSRDNFVRPSGRHTSLGVASEPPKVKDVVGLILRRLRRYFEDDPPESESHLLQAVKVILSAARFDFTEECEDIHLEGRCSRPDLEFSDSSIAVKIKLLNSENQVKRAIAEMMADIHPLRDKFNDVVFVVYDLGFISDEAFIRRHLEEREGVHLVIIRH